MPLYNLYHPDKTIPKEVVELVGDVGEMIMMILH